MVIKFSTPGPPTRALIKDKTTEKTAFVIVGRDLMEEEEEVDNPIAYSSSSSHSLSSLMINELSRWNLKCIPREMQKKIIWIQACY